MDIVRKPKPVNLTKQKLAAINGVKPVYEHKRIFVNNVTWSPAERREIRNYYYSVFQLAKD